MPSNIQYDGKIISLSPLPLYHEMGMGELIFDLMHKHKEHVAQIDGITGERDTYDSMLKRCIRTAITMRCKGVTSKDIISVCSFNNLDVHVPIIASMFLGVKFASFDFRFTLDEIIYHVKLIQSKLLFVGPNVVETIEEALRLTKSNAEIVVFGDTDTRHVPFRDFLVQSSEEDAFQPKKTQDLKETYCIFFSSGTTGFPKGICLNHLMGLSIIPSFYDAQEQTRGVILSHASIYWGSSFLFLKLAIQSGSARVILPAFDLKNLWSYVEKYKVNTLHLFVSQIAALLSEKRPNNDLSCLKSILTGGSYIDRGQIDALKQLLPEVAIAVSYGLTEIGPALSFKPTTNPEDVELLLEKPESCGRPNPGYSYKVVDPITEEILGVHQPGELRIKTDYKMNGYYKTSSSDVWDSEGFIKTGDIAYYDEQFRFFIVDRIKEIIKCRSAQVVPSKLEGILRTHPAVENAVVFGVPHHMDLHHPTAVVTLKPEATVTPEQIRAFLDAKVTDSERLRGGVKIVESIPETPSGKFKRNYTRDLFIENKL